MAFSLFTLPKAWKPRRSANYSKHTDAMPVRVICSAVLCRSKTWRCCCPTVLDDRFQQQRLHSRRQIVPHPLDDLQSGTDNRFRRIASRCRRQQRVVGTMDDQCRSADSCQFAMPVTGGNDRQQLPALSARIVRTRNGPHQLPAQLDLVGGKTGTTDDRKDEQQPIPMCVENPASRLSKRIT